MILCCGESLIDMVPEAGTFRPLPGGSVYNTAVALGRLGAPTGYLWPISTDPFGVMLLPPLAEAGVDTSLCPRPDRLTTLAFVTLTGGDARYDFYDEGTAGRLFAPEDLPDLPAATALLIGGISLVPDPCGSAIEALVAREGARLPVYLDPNIRPFFIADPAAHRARLTRLLRQSAIVKLSSDDMDWLWPGLAAEQVAAQVLALGPKLVLVTSGSAGATGYTAQRRVSVPAQPVVVADTIGAGDTFSAGLLAALHAAGALSHAGLAALDDATLAAALGKGIAAAAVTVSRPGANPPWAYEL